MTRRIADLDVPLTTLRQQIADLVARQRADRAEESAQRLRDFLAPTNPTTAKEAS